MKIFSPILILRILSRRSTQGTPGAGLGGSPVFTPTPRAPTLLASYPAFLEGSSPTFSAAIQDTAQLLQGEGGGCDLPFQVPSCYLWCVGHQLCGHGGQKVSHGYGRGGPWGCLSQSEGGRRQGLITPAGPPAPWVWLQPQSPYSCPSADTTAPAFRGHLV